MVSCLAPKTAVRQTLAVRGAFMAICLAFGILYVVQVSAVSTKGYDIASLEKEIQALEEDNQRLAVEIAKHSSIAHVQSRVAALHLVAAEQVDYVKIIGTTVARR